MARSLLLSCSKLKRVDAADLPAIHRYDGPAFRLLRRYLRSTENDLEVYILSSEFGMIRGDRAIPNYERRMTLQRARELQPLVTQQTEQILECNKRKNSWEELFINLGKTYLRAFETARHLFAVNSKLRIASGSHGKRLSEMYDWLYGGQASTRQLLSTDASGGVARIRGVEIKLRPEEILSLARDALAHGDHSSSFHSWYVPIDDHSVSPKWLVSLLTALPVSAFHSEEAIRILSKLGVEVRRV